MQVLRRELILHICLTSFMLSILYSFLMVRFGASFLGGPQDTGSVDGMPVFAILFFVLYAIHLLISALNYMTARLAGGSLPGRVLSFHAIGLLLIGVLCYLTQDLTVLLLIFSLAVFSLISLLWGRSDG